jgi:hypothetical protein
MIRSRRKRVIIGFLAAFLLLGSAVFLRFPKTLDSANLTSASDTLETSRLSVYGKNAETLTAGSTIIKMATSGQPSNSTINIFPGDTVVYPGSANTYTVDQIIDSDEFSVTTGLNAADTDATDTFYIARTAQHTVAFTTTSAVPNGAIKIRVKAGATNNNDSKPDQDGFDFHSLSDTDVTCPADVTGYYDFVSGTATPSGGTNCAAGYHCFECRYSGSGNAGQALSVTIGGTSELINPAPASGHTAGTADTYSVIIDNLDANDAAIDSTTVKVAVIESVRVTATVNPTISFVIAALGVGSTACGNALDVATTATTVPLGSLSITSFIDAAQQLTASTNADGGYAVTAVENDQLSRIDDSTVEIPDLVGGATGSSTDWTSTSTKGFGYSLENVDAASVTFAYNDLGGTFQARQFPATADSESPLTIFSSSTVADNEDVYVCYRAIISSTQEAGDYWNAITYRATATF